MNQHLSSTAEIDLPPTVRSLPLDRRSDVEIKHERVARLLADAGCEGVFIMDPANFRCLTGGAAPRGLAAPGEEPALYLSTQGRWLICSNVDSQRLFDEELDGLGFQLKEWQWYVDREAYLTELAAGRRVACDRPFRDWLDVGGFLARERATLSYFEQERMRDLGKMVAHALEATARTLSSGITENEIAGQVAHRLQRHGTRPWDIQVAGDGRGRRYPRHGPTDAAVRRRCTIQATSEKFGLFATAARSICFGVPDDAQRQDWNLATRLNVVCLAVSTDGERVNIALDRAARALLDTPAEHDWRLAPLGYRTGHAPADVLLLPESQDRFVAGSAHVWQARVGDAVICDTFLLGESGWTSVTPAEEWPLRRAMVQETRYERPDVLVLPE